MPPHGKDIKPLSAEFVQSLSAELNQSLASWNASFSPLRKWWSTHRSEIASCIVSVYESFAAIPEDVRSFSKSLASRGWYIDSEMPITILRPALACFNEGRESEVDKFFIRHLTERIDSLQEQLLVAYPLRSKPLAQAFAAHRSGQYDLSIPVFLAQADGICAEALGGKLFKKIKGRPQVAQYLETLNLPDYSGMFLSVLGLPGGICANEEFRDKFPNCLNRHEILHGIDSNYGTEINSWKAISLIGFVGIFAASLRTENTTLREFHRAGQKSL